MIIRQGDGRTAAEVMHVCKPPTVEGWMTMGSVWGCETCFATWTLGEKDTDEWLYPNHTNDKFFGVRWYKND